MEHKTVSVPSISCGHCVLSIKKELEALTGIKTVDASSDRKQVAVDWEPPATWEQITQALRRIGRPAQ